MKYKVIFWVCVFIFLGSLFFLKDFFAGKKGFAAVSGPCSNCHTMHNSYEGRPMAYNGTFGSNATRAEPYEMLLRYSCIGCHSGLAGSSTNSIGAPIVYHTTSPGQTGPGYTLAGGDFYWVVQGEDRKGHNVAGLVNQDSLFGYTPPGWDPGATEGNQRGQIANGTSSWSQQLTCWGIYGCHGTNTYLKGHHLNITGQVNGTDVYSSYRFLYGIKGYEDKDWQWTATSTDHNEYAGYEGFSKGNVNYSQKYTISYLCGECHGIFYTKQHSGSAWLRHPSDYLLPNSGEYANYNNRAGYSILAPVARPTTFNFSNSTDSVTPGSDAIVMCLSCHRAHGSEFNSILRWDYSVTPNGCKVCHTQK